MHERSWLVCRAVVTASFINDASLSAVIEDEGRFLGSIGYQERVWREYRPEVHVKAIGSADTVFRSGETDLRGIFIAENRRGRATVIAREGDCVKDRVTGACRQPVPLHRSP